MAFTLIHAGTFMMGSSGEDDPDADDDEIPRHPVTLTQDYYMQTTGVTQGQYEAIMGPHTFAFPDCGEN